MRKSVFIIIIIIAILGILLGGYVLLNNDNKIIINFNTNSETKLSSVEIKKGESINLPSLERDGYEFLGWYIDDEKIDNNYKFDKLTYLNAKWEKKLMKKTYKVVFNSNGGTTVPSQTVEEGGYIVKPKNPQRDNYDFCGWDFESSTFDFTTPITRDIVLNACWGYSGEGDASGKPLIYLYPEKEMDVEVKLGKMDIVTTIYPKYEKSWQVKAYPNGKLIDKKTGRELYGLYWEGKNYYPANLNEGFVVKGEDTVKFLEEKLAILGLTERETEEFIIYWLPQMEHNKYNYIRFAGNYEMDKYMPLEITPKPDTVIRILMEFKPLTEKINVKEQKLEKVERKGFTAVEWGGSLINSDLNKAR